MAQATNERLHRGYVDIGFGQLHYARAGRDGASRPLLLLNPRVRSLLPMLPTLASDRVVTIVDIPGFGVSSAPPPGTSMAEIGASLLPLLDAFGIARVDLYGCNTGHKLATAFAAGCPERVGRLVVCGKTHSLVPDQARRNAAMKRHMDENHTDIAILRLEGRFLDDQGEQAGFAAVFEANFAFDFAAALAQVRVPTLVIEITTPREDAAYGRQGAAVAGLLRDGRCVAEEETDPTGLFLYTGIARMAGLVRGFLEAVDG